MDDRSRTYRFYVADDSHLYNGKEFDRMRGLDWYDYGARMYNLAVGLWTQVAPLAENKLWKSPYLFCSGNP